MTKGNRQQIRFKKTRQNCNRGMVPFKEAVTEKIIHIFTLHPVRIKQGRLSTCNITIRCISPTTAAVQKQYYVF